MQRNTHAPDNASNGPEVRLLALVGACAVAAAVVIWGALFAYMQAGLHLPAAAELAGFALVGVALLVLALGTGVAVEHVHAARALSASAYPAPPAAAARVVVEFISVPGLRPPVSFA